MCFGAHEPRLGLARTVEPLQLLPLLIDHLQASTPEARQRFDAGTGLAGWMQPTGGTQPGSRGGTLSTAGTSITGPGARSPDPGKHDGPAASATGGRGGAGRSPHLGPPRSTAEEGWR